MGGLDDMKLQEASRWHARAQTGLSSADRNTFLAWLRAAPDNAAAMDLVSRAWTLSGEVSVATPARSSSRAGRRRAPARDPLWAGMAVAASVAAVTAMAALPSTQTYRTGPAERTRVRLADGTGVIMAPGSRLETAFNAFERKVVLERGEAEFAVRADARRFSVAAAGYDIRDTGTRFGVRRETDGVRVLLREGGVEVRADGRTVARLVPGQVMQAGPPGGAVAVRTADMTRELGWQSGRLTFSDTRLADALKDFERYGGVRITVTNPGAGELRVSGVYGTGDAASFLKGVERLYGVRSRATAPGVYEVGR